MSDQRLLSELARAKAVFQLRAILTHMGIDPDAICKRCNTAPCGCPDAIYAGVVPGGSK